MEIRIHIKLILLLFVFAKYAIAGYDTIDQEQFCTAAKFIYNQDGARQDAFNTDPMNIEGEHSYHQHTVAINAKITKGVNTKKKATMDTKQAVVLAIFGTAFTENGENIEITQKFREVAKGLKISASDTYKTDTTYLHYAALHTIEALANHLVRDALGLASRLIEKRQEIYFGNLSFLTGIDHNAFIELFGLAQQTHRVGVDIRKGITGSASKIDVTAIATVEVVLERTLSNESESSELKAVFSTFEPIKDHGFHAGNDANNKRTPLLLTDSSVAHYTTPPRVEKEVTDTTPPTVTYSPPTITPFLKPFPASIENNATKNASHQVVLSPVSVGNNATAVTQHIPNWTKTYLLKNGKEKIIRTCDTITHIYSGGTCILWCADVEDTNNEAGILNIEENNSNFMLSLEQTEEAFEVIINQIDPTFRNSAASAPRQNNTTIFTSWRKCLI